MTANVSEFEKCPSCQEPKHLDLSECPYCGVFYQKASIKEGDFGPQANVDLNLLERWQELLEDYEKQEKHEAFLQEALAKKNLAFASQQYRKLLEVNSHDEMAKKMQDRIVQLAMVNLMSNTREQEPPKKSGMFYLLLFMAVISFVLAMITKSTVMYYVALLLVVLMVFTRYLKRRYH